jgi:hypothetical protein
MVEKQRFRFQTTLLLCCFPWEAFLQMLFDFFVVLQKTAFEIYFAVSTFNFFLAALNLKCLSIGSGLPDFSECNIPKLGKNIPKLGEIYKMAIKFT